MQTINPNDYWTATAFAVPMPMPMPMPNNPAPAHNAPITICGEDGSMYCGHVKNGEKHGQGILKTEIYISGVVGDENSHMAKWTEFEGEWENGLLHGRGVMRQMSDKGVVRVVHDGMWDTGVPVMQLDRAAVERLIMSSLTTDQEFNFMKACDPNLPWFCGN